MKPVLLKSKKPNKPKEPQKVLPQYQMVYDLCRERWQKKRDLGISSYRPDGSVRDPDSEGNAGCAELVVCEAFGQEFDENFYGFGGDGGSDLRVKMRAITKIDVAGVGVQWLGYRSCGNILVNVDDPERYEKTHFFVLVAGNVFDGLRIVGWATKNSMYERTPRCFGYGLRYWKPDVLLSPIEKLLKNIVRD